MKSCYIHVPFCKHICAYCDFVRCGYQEYLADQWLVRVCDDLKSLPQGLTTIYIGGGTPSALSNSQLQTLLTNLSPFRNDIQEYTIEANPDSLTDEKIEIIKNGGINRISLGVQTFQKNLQQQIQREHSLADIQTLLETLRTHDICNISIDLMYGLPSQTLRQWQEDLSIAVSLPIQHISLYALTIEEHSSFGRNGVKNIDPQLEADMYEYAIAFLQKHDFIQYEISNFAKEDKMSKHNLAYWNYDDFIGIGCGASGKHHHMRYDNTHNLHTYITQGASPKVTPLDKEDEMFEMLMMSLRLNSGLSLTSFQSRFDCDITYVYRQPVNKHINLQNLLMEDGYLKTTYQGRLLLNDILVDFLADEKG